MTMMYQGKHSIRLLLVLEEVAACTKFQLPKTQ